LSEERRRESELKERVHRKAQRRDVGGVPLGATERRCTAPGYVGGKSLGATEGGARHWCILRRRQNVRGGAPRCLGGAGKDTGVVCDVSSNPVPDIPSTKMPQLRFSFFPCIPFCPFFLLLEKERKIERVPIFLQFL
jgi:hypothetical protein